MPKALEEITKDALELAPRQRLALAEFLLESAEAASDPDAEAEWEAEIRERLRAIDEGRKPASRMRMSCELQRSEWLRDDSLRRSGAK